MLQEVHHSSDRARKIPPPPDERSVNIQMGRSLIQYVLIEESGMDISEWISQYSPSIGNLFDTDMVLQELCAKRDFEGGKKYIRDKFSNLPAIAQGTSFDELVNKAKKAA